MTDRYYQAMRQKGFSSNTMDSIRKVKCPKCDTEFYMKEMPHIATPLKERAVASHMSKINADYYDENGWKRSR